MRYGYAVLLAALAAYGCGSNDDDASGGNSPDGGVGGSGGSGGGAGTGGSAGGAGSDAQADSGGSDGGFQPTYSDAGALTACSAEELGIADGGALADGGAEIDAGGDAGPPLANAKRLIPGAAVPVGITDDGYLLYRDNAKLSVASLTNPKASFDVSSIAGNAAVKGRVVVQWSNIDYAAGRADLTVWTGARCVRTIQRTLSADDSVAASADGSKLLYATNVTDTTFDVVAASRDFAAQQVIAAGVGRASDSTCRADYGFAGSRIVVASCSPGSRDAALSVFDAGPSGWTKTDVSTTASGNWAADALGAKLFYTTSKSAGLYWNGGAGPGESVDDGVGQGSWNANGSAVLYTVGDQLRRASPPDFAAIPIVTNKFRYLGAYSPDFNYALYSTTVTYEGGEKRDLLLTRTTSFNANPTKLVPTPAARLSRSAFTGDGKYALYLTELDEQGAGTLHVQPSAGGAEQTFPGVDTVTRAGSSMIVFSDGRDTTNYPVVAALKVLDAASGLPPAVLRAAVIDGRSFYVTPDQQAVVYARPRAGQDTSTDGIWIHPLL
jgi:hypothetical protein